MFPVLRETYEDLLAASEATDLLVSHLPWAMRLVAEKTGIPWVSTMITPFGFFSGYDVPVFPFFPFLSRKLRFLGPRVWRPVFRAGAWLTRPWAKPITRLRAEIGLPPATDLNPISDSHSPLRVLALFSPRLADKQPDWPPQTVHTGFPLYDRHGTGGLPKELERFLNDGPPPIVFTLSWSAAPVAGSFYQHSVAAARQLGRRAVLIFGCNLHDRPPSLPDGMIAFDYAPFSELFPRAAAIVHPAGIGTTGLAMRAGRPMLVVPFAHDQPDNAEHLSRLGIARIVSRHRYTPDRVAAELRHLLDNPAYAQRASAVGEQVRQEDGVRTACDALEALLGTATSANDPQPSPALFTFRET
jgi:UDP:flavonoid glycosyltransferase YjiC (YdhE family)